MQYDFQHKFNTPDKKDKNLPVQKNHANLRQSLPKILFKSNLSIKVQELPKLNKKV